MCIYYKKSELKTIKSIINQSIRDYLNLGGDISVRLSEDIHRDKSKKVLFVDKDGKHVVFDNGRYRIVVDNPESATYITLWHKEVINDREHWAKRGVLDAWVSRMDFKEYDGTFLSVRSIEIESAHRNLGYGKKMYQALIDFSGDNISGIFSYLPNRVNNKEISTIYNKLGGIIDNDYHFIHIIN